ncbi:hypothetical protein OWV82_016534 [Melia azedarach]|uniref:Uncharacterized protein n=1 Tax=Melia azedarach TaxID=155640 RepID=A0ACC1XFX2_MELAZ|nr:hypothetical protein OWV82_016534 [Melia azedarach]
MWKEVLGVEPTIEDVHASFTLTTASNKPGLFYLRKYISQLHVVPQVNPNIVDKAWDDFWFVASSDWGHTVIEDGETYSVPTYFRWAGDVVTLGDEGLTPSPAAMRMAKGSKTDRALLDLVKDRMRSSPRPKRSKKVEGTRSTTQLAMDLEGVLGGHFAHASRVVPTLKQILKLSDSKKGNELAGLGPDQAIDVASQFFLQAQFQAEMDKANELQVIVDKLEAEAGTNLLHGYHFAQYQVTKEFLDLDLHHMEFGFDWEALITNSRRIRTLLTPQEVHDSSPRITH